MMSVTAAAVAWVLHSTVLPAGPSASIEAPRFQQIAEGWEDLSPTERDRAMRNYRNYMELPAEKRHDVDQRYEKWKKLPRNDQDRFRQKHDQYRGMGLVDD